MGNAFTGNVALSDTQTKSAYAHSFGLMEDKSKYADAWNKVDARREVKSLLNKGMKALETTTGGSGSTDQTLIPIYVDTAIVDTSRKYTPLVELIPRVTNNGLTAEYNRITAKGSAFTAAEDAALSEANDTYERKSVSIKYLYSVGRVTGQSQAAMPSYLLQAFQPSGSGITNQNPFSNVSAQNAKQLEVQMKARALKEKEEDLIVNGDSSSDSTEFDGIVKLQGTTNQIDAGGKALTYRNVENATRTAYENGGRLNLAISSTGVISDIKDMMINQFRYNVSVVNDTSGALPFGVPSAIMLDTYNGKVPVIPSTNLTNVSGSKKLYFLDTDYIEMRVLQDMTYEDLAHTNDSQKFMLKIYEALVMKAPEFNAFVDNIA